MSAIVASGLGRRFGKRWALRDCNIDIPEGRIAALVGPNGAGKTTLLHLVVALLRPTTGSVSVFNGDPSQSKELLPRIGFVAQETPLYRSFTVAEMLRLGQHLNRSWDRAMAESRLSHLDIPFQQRVGSLSGGQRAQVSLTLAIAKHPDLLLLDEPLASLDPLARREFLQGLMEIAAESGMTVVLSSHLVADLERVCDYLVVLSAARTQVAGDIDELLETHRLVTGPRRDQPLTAGVISVVREEHTDRQTTMLVRTNGPILDPAWLIEPVGLEDLVIAYLGSPRSSALPAPRVEGPEALAVS